jgi:hypothetical protein
MRRIVAIIALAGFAGLGLSACHTTNPYTLCREWAEANDSRYSTVADASLFTSSIDGEQRVRCLVHHRNTLNGGITHCHRVVIDVDDHSWFFSTVCTL